LRSCCVWPEGCLRHDPRPREHQGLAGGRRHRHEKRVQWGSGKRFVGSGLSLTSEYELVENLNFTAIYTHFFAGDFIRDTGSSEDIDFIELTLQFKF
jgi:hypothetical protein